MDPEQLLIDLLQPHVGSARVSTRPAQTAPYVRVRLVGGTALNRRQDRPMLTVEATHTTETKARTLLEVCRTVLLEAASVRSTGVHGVTEVGGPANLPDPATPNLERYTMTVQLSVRRYPVRTP